MDINWLWTDLFEKYIFLILYATLTGAFFSIWLTHRSVFVHLEFIDICFEFIHGFSEIENP